MKKYFFKGELTLILFDLKTIDPTGFKVKLNKLSNPKKSGILDALSKKI